MMKIMALYTLQYAIYPEFDFSDKDEDTSDSEHESKDNHEEHAEQNEKDEIVALDDPSSVDEYTAPRQKIVINN